MGSGGQDEPRIREILRRGTLVVGASRFRWPGWDPHPAAIDALLATFPDPDPARVFAAKRYMQLLLLGD